MTEINEANRRLHNQTINSKRLRMLRDGPKTQDEIGSFNPGPLRQMVAKIKIPQISARGQGEGAYQATAVYYLYGDDRRAIRKFLNENFDFVSEQMKKSHNPLRNNMDDILFQMLCEEYQMLLEYDDSS